ncbi:hypothetical protein EGW08_014498 [Elysia chlorotica]|uniref:Major facilitator superfamily (MFS) profile domain-containing protein n=1 Tax=Elysia chlorotica TaxID=188477 RepID=A0A433T834_ELYCH|nr:hypothetical protein EGW08_014498 [Elysia chlorotica]
MSSSWVAFFGLMFFVLAFAPGAGPMPWTVNAELYPLWARSVANSLSTWTNWCCNYIVSNLFLTAAKVFSISGILFGFSVVCLMAALFSAYAVPETRNISLEQLGKGSFSAVSSVKTTATLNDAVDILQLRKKVKHPEKSEEIVSATQSNVYTTV